MSERAPQSGRAAVKPVTDDEALALFSVFLPGSHLLLAVSGGADSMAMMALAAAVAEALQLKLSIATIDHGLRIEAALETALVAKSAAELGLECQVLNWQGQKPATRLQEAARKARYALLFAHADKIGASHVLCAHTLDDQAETMLFRMARGTGLDGMAAMRPLSRRGTIILARPLLEISKARLIATCAGRNIKFVEDRSNADPRFARVRFRRQMPQLAFEGLTAARLGQLAKRVARAEDALNSRASAVFFAALRPGLQAERLALEAGLIVAEPFEIVLRVLEHGIYAVRSRLEDEGSFIPIRLNRLEALCENFLDAAREGATWRQTLAGLSLSLDRRGILLLSLAPPRQMSRKG